jgi:tetratricopeptide (TPR) repeat protein
VRNRPSWPSRKDRFNNDAGNRTALEIQQKLAGDHPAVTDFLHLLAASHHALGVLLSDTGKPAAAAELRKALEMFEKLLDDHPAVTLFRYSLAYSHNGLGWLMSRRGKPTAAAAEFHKAVALFRNGAEDDPSQPYAWDVAASVYNNLSVVLRPLDRLAEARDHAERAVALRELLVRTHPESIDYRAGLAENCLNRGLARRTQGEHAGAAADIRQALALYGSLPSFSREEWFLGACCHAALAVLAGQAGSGVAPEDRQSEADQATALLHQAVAMGYSNSDAYRTEDALDPLRDRDDFRLLLMDLEMPAEPFASGPRVTRPGRRSRCRVRQELGR